MYSRPTIQAQTREVHWTQDELPSAWQKPGVLHISLGLPVASSRRIPYQLTHTMISDNLSDVRKGIGSPTIGGEPETAGDCQLGISPRSGSYIQRRG